jgi:hypothetical protein
MFLIDYRISPDALSSDVREKNVVGLFDPSWLQIKEQP